MRRYWDARAVENAVWYVDTTVDYDHPDMVRFLADGRRVAEEAILHAPVRPERHELAVEIGSGLGRVSLAMADYFDRVIGIDVSAEMVWRASDLIVHPQVTFEVGDGSTLRLVPDESADFVLSFTVLQHIPKVSIIEGYLAESARILRSGGVAALQWNNDPNPLRWKTLALARAALHRLGVPGRHDKRNAHHFSGSRVPVRRVTNALERSGLDVVGTRGEGTLWAWIWARKP